MTRIHLPALFATGMLLLATPLGAQNAPAAGDVRAGTYVLEKTHAKLNWAVSHFGFSTYSGEFTKFDARLTLDPKSPEKSAFNATVDMASVETNDDKLDEHLRAPDFFDTAKFPTATYRSTRVERTGATTARVTGNLTLHGVTKPVTLNVTFNRAGDNPVSKAYVAGFSATGTIKRTDFGISTFAPAVGEDVTLTFSGEFNPAA